MGKSTPKAPDPARAVEAQAVANKDAAATQANLNRINEFTPLGSSEFSQEFDQAAFDKALADYEFNLSKLSPFQKALGGTRKGGETIQAPDPSDPDFQRFSRTTSLNPTAQSTFDQQQQLGLSLAEIANQQAGRVGNTLGTELDFSGLPELPQIDEAARLRIEDALYGRQANRLNQRFGDQQRQLDQTLANQGIQRGSEAFNRSQESFGRDRNDAFDIALQNAIAGGASEQGRLFGLGQAARNQGLQELLTQRNQPINDISALLSNSQVSMPNFGGVSQVGVGAPDVLGANALALQQGNLKAQQGQQLQNNLFSLGGGLGAAAILAPSDRRLKRGIKYIGELLNGLNVYVYDYIWGDRSMGVMADEVKERFPEAVVNISGFDHVKYAEIL